VADTAAGARVRAPDDTIGAAAIRRIVNLGYSIDFADLVVGIVLEELSDPDRAMLDAGLDELNLALGKPADRQHGAGYRRDLLAVVWHAMLDRAL
jgi:hypothetical protein